MNLASFLVKFVTKFTPCRSRGLSAWRGGCGTTRTIHPGRTIDVGRRRFRGGKPSSANAAGPEAHAQPRQGHALRMRHAADDRGPHAFQCKILPHRDAVHSVRYRGGVLPRLGRSVSRSDEGKGMEHVAGGAGVSGNSRGRAHLRVEEGRAGLGAETAEEGRVNREERVAFDPKVEGRDVVVTRLDAAVDWGGKNSVWPMPLGLACCGIELMAVGARRFDT